MNWLKRELKNVGVTFKEIMYTFYKAKHVGWCTKWEMIICEYLLFTSTFLFLVLLIYSQKIHTFIFTLCYLRFVPTHQFVDSLLYSWLLFILSKTMSVENVLLLERMRWKLCKFSLLCHVTFLFSFWCLYV